MRTDSLVIHNDDIGEVVGDFHGVPIKAWDPRDTEARDRVDARIRAANARNYVHDGVAE